MTLFLTVLLPFLAVLPPLLVRRHGDQRSRLAGLCAIPTAAALALVVAAARDVFAGAVPQASVAWIPSLGLHATLRMDGYAWVFACLVLGIGLLILLYARYYLSAREDLPRFFSAIMLFMGSMLGLVLAGNIILLVVFWELTSLSSFLLIGYWRHDEDARAGARMALIVTGVGGLALLGGVLLLGAIAGSHELSAVLAAAGSVQQHPLYVPMLVLVLLGAFTKSAQFPFHFWLPRAMAAPTPVSAYLHSATMVKAGVFLLGRLHPVLSGTPEWFYIVSITGMATLLLGAYRAMFAHDLKGLLAFSTVSHLGLITLLFGFSSPLGAVAAVFHIMNHATFKASLFMAAGIIDHETGTRDMRILNGLWRHMPYTTALAVLAAAAMAGVPLLNGFLSKEMFFAESLFIAEMRGLRPIEPVLAVVAGIFSVAYSLRFIRIFFRGSGTGMPRAPQEPPRFMRIPVEVLVLVVVLVGILPGLVIGPSLAIGARAVLGGDLPYYHLTMWHGLNLPLLMSVIALAGGTLLFLVRRKLYAVYGRVHPPVTIEAGYQGVARAASAGAAWLTGTLDNGSLQRYVLLLVGMALLAGAVPVIGRFSAGALPRTPVDAVTVAGTLMLVTAAVATAALHRHRLVALIAISAVGVIVSAGFVRLAAPDLALTQLLVEIVTILLVLLALDYLPRRSPPDTRAASRVRDIGIAAAAGAGVAALAWGVLTRPADSISRYFIEQSKPAGGGTNIVNVILVDFRGFDTLGEIAVLGIAALGVVLLLSGVDLTASRQHGEVARDRAPLFLTMITRALLPFALLFALFLLLRGHNLPGGGFIAGLMAAVALILHYVASGTHWTESRLRLRYRPLIAIGLLTALATGLGALAFGHPFLSATFTYVDLPGFGEIELATALVFDVGVFLTVVGAVMLMLSRLGEPVPESPADAAFPTEAAAWKP
ncbi:MAG TPA: monovalent cation/H+ antiporter subunit A [Longimicrobiales bacterium]